MLIFGFFQPIILLGIRLIAGFILKHIFLKSNIFIGSHLCDTLKNFALIFDSKIVIGVKPQALIRCMLFPPHKNTEIINGLFVILDFSVAAPV